MKEDLKFCNAFFGKDDIDFESINVLLDDAIENELFRVENSPAKLSKHQESTIFHFMARFVLVAAMPYMQTDWAMPTDTLAGRLFNFVMTEVQRYYKK